MRKYKLNNGATSLRTVSEFLRDVDHKNCNACKHREKGWDDNPCLNCDLDVFEPAQLEGIMTSLGHIIMELCLNLKDIGVTNLNNLNLDVQKVIDSGVYDGKGKTEFVWDEKISEEEEIALLKVMTEGKEKEELKGKM